MDNKPNEFKKIYCRKFEEGCHLFVNFIFIKFLRERNAYNMGIKLKIFRNANS